MCELLFKHVGEFREHATRLATEIIDNLHRPSMPNHLKPVDEKRLQNKNIGSSYKVFLDEADNSLYFSAEEVLRRLQATGSADPGRHGTKAGKHMLFELDNIIFKITHPGETVFTIPNDGPQARDSSEIY